MPTPVTPTTLAAFLIVEGAVAAVRDPAAVQGQPPVAGRLLSNEETRTLGLTDPGMTLAYPAEGRLVFFDIGKDRFRVWFTEGDFGEAAAYLDATLRRAHPQLVVLGEGDHPAGGALGLLRYAVPFEGGRVAEVSVTYAQPDALGDQRMFFAEIIAQQQVQ